MGTRPKEGEAQGARGAEKGPRVSLSRMLEDAEPEIARVVPQRERRNGLFFADAKRMDNALRHLAEKDVPAAIHNILAVMEGSMFRDEQVRENTYPVFADGQLTEARVYVRLVLDEEGRIVGCLGGRYGSCTNAAGVADYYAAPKGYRYVEATILSSCEGPTRIYMWNLCDRQPSDFADYLKNVPETLWPLDGLMIGFEKAGKK